MILFDILLWVIAGFFGFAGLKPLKESAEYRFTKIKPLLKGCFYIGTAITAVFVGWWAMIVGIPIAYLIEKSDKSGQKLLD